MWESIWLLLTFSFISVREKHTSFLWKLSCWNTNISFACMLKKVKAFLFEKETCRVVELYSEKLLHPFQMYLMLEEVAHFFWKVEKLQSCKISLLINFFFSPISLLKFSNSSTWLRESFYFRNGKFPQYHLFLDFCQKMNGIFKRRALKENVQKRLPITCSLLKTSLWCCYDKVQQKCHRNIFFKLRKLMININKIG